jgi:hypothetical protein
MARLSAEERAALERRCEELRVEVRLVEAVTSGRGAAAVLAATASAVAIIKVRI